MIRERRYIRCGFSASKITMRLECHVNGGRDPLSNVVQACCYPIAGFIMLRPRLNLVREHTNQRSTELRCQISMGQRDTHLFGSLTRIRRMKRARSVNATNLDTLVSEICPRRRELSRSKLRKTE
jgi:hypothetical protein